MRKYIPWWVAFIFLSAGVFAQNARYDAPFPSISSTSAPFLIANTSPNSPIISVCHSPANGLPCTNFATTYTSTGSACPNGAQDTPQPQPSSCQSTGDAQGNIGFWAPQGIYDYTICISVICYGPYTVTLTAPSSTLFINAGNCPAMNETCLPSPFPSNTSIVFQSIPQSTNIFTVNPVFGIPITNVQGSSLMCDAGIKFRPPSTGGSVELFLINGGTGQLSPFNFNCGDIGGFEYSTALNNGTVQVTNGGTSLIFSNAPSALQQAAMSLGGSNAGWLVVYGTVSGDPNPQHAVGVKIAANGISGCTPGAPCTLVGALASPFLGLSCSISIPLNNPASPLNGQTGCPFEIVWGTQNAMQVNDVVYSLNGGTLVGSSGTAILTVPGGQNANLSSGEYITLGRTGFVGSGNGMTSFNGNWGPITISTGCSGLGVCILTFPSPITGSAALTNLSQLFISPSNVTVSGNFNHASGQCLAVASNNNDPAELTHDLQVLNSKVHDCGSGGIVSSRANRSKIFNDQVWNIGGAGAGGGGLDLTQTTNYTAEGVDISTNFNLAQGFHHVFDFTGTEEQIKINDVPSSLIFSANTCDHIDTSFNVTASDITINGSSAVFGNSSFVGCGLGNRIETSQNVKWSGAIANTGTLGVLVNSRLESIGTYNGTNSSTNAAGTASCVSNPAVTNCTTPSGHQLNSFDVPLTAINNGQSFHSSGANADINFVTAVPLLNDQATPCVSTAQLSATNPFQCFADTVNKIEGAGSLQICVNAGSGQTNCSGAPVQVWNSGCTTPQTCTIASLRIQGTGGGLLVANGGGAINFLTLPIWRIAFAGTPTTTFSTLALGITAGDFRIGFSSQNNCSAPEGYKDIQAISGSNIFSYQEITPENWMKFSDFPGIQTICLMTKIGGTTSQYSSIHIDDMAVDVPGREAGNVIANSIIYHPRGGCIAVCGGADNVSIVGNQCNHPGYDSNFSTGGYPHNAITFDDGLSSAFCIAGPPMIGGLIWGNVGYNDLNADAQSVGVSFFTEGSGTIDRVKTDCSGFSDLQFNTPCNLQGGPNKATNIAPVFPGGVKTVVGGIPPTCQVIAGGMGTGAGCLAFTAQANQNPSSDDTKGQIKLTATCTGGCTATTPFTLTFNTPYSNFLQPLCFIQFNDSGGITWDGSARIRRINSSGNNINQFTLVNGATNFVAGNYLLDYQCN